MSRTDALAAAADRESQPASFSVGLAEVDRMAGEYLDLFRPTTEHAVGLVKRLALLRVRLERCSRHEFAAVRARVLRAREDFDEARQCEVDDLVKDLDVEPRVALRKLERMPEGVDRLLKLWSNLRADLTHPSRARWSPQHSEVAERLCGRSPADIGPCRIRFVADGLLGDLEYIHAEIPEGLTPDAELTWLHGELVKEIDQKLDRLRKLAETFDPADLEALRAGAADRALFDASKEATEARRYEAATAREADRIVKELKALGHEPVRSEAPAAPAHTPPPAKPTKVAQPAQAPAPRPLGSLGAGEIEPKAGLASLGAGVVGPGALASLGAGGVGGISVPR